MNNQEEEILNFLEESYSGAKMSGDIMCMIRLARAIAAFSSDPEDAPEAIFTSRFLSRYFADEETV